jgi:hypothetical protein
MILHLPEESKGKYESVLEACISTDPINVKHNPFYSGSFNGNDCQRLMHNFELLFDCLHTEANQAMSEEEKESVIDISNRYQVIWDACNAILPVLRSKEKTETETEIQAILDAINDFWVAYVDNCEGSVTRSGTYTAAERLLQRGSLGPNILLTAYSAILKNVAP